MSTSVQSLLAASCFGLTPGGVVICPDPQNPLHETFAASESTALCQSGPLKLQAASLECLQTLFLESASDI